MLVSSIGCLVSGIATAFSPWFELFVFLRFLSAAFSHGAFLIMFVYGNWNVITGCFSIDSLPRFKQQIYLCTGSRSVHYMTSFVEKILNVLFPNQTNNALWFNLGAIFSLRRATLWLLKASFKWIRLLCVCLKAVFINVTFERNQKHSLSYRNQSSRFCRYNDSQTLFSIAPDHSAGLHASATNLQHMVTLTMPLRIKPWMLFNAFHTSHCKTSANKSRPRQWQNCYSRTNINGVIF